MGSLLHFFLTQVTGHFTEQERCLFPHLFTPDQSGRVDGRKWYDSGIRQYPVVVLLLKTFKPPTNVGIFLEETTRFKKSLSPSTVDPSSGDFNVRQEFLQSCKNPSPN